MPDCVESLLAELVSVDTVNPAFGGRADGAAALAVRIEAIARAWGLGTRRSPVDDAGAFNLLVSVEATQPGDWLLFESHLDTVSVEGMSVPPFRLTERGDRLYGRGACDTKGSGAAMLWALRDYAQTANRPVNAGVLFVVDEEAGMTGAQAFAARELRSWPRLRGMIVGEPTRLRPVIAHNGVLRWRTITRGLAAHSADPRRGRSAISAMLPVVAALEEQFIPTAIAAHPLTGRAAASINVIRGGRAVNVIPDFCEIHCDRRLVPGEDFAQVLATRDSVLRGLGAEHDQLYLAPPLAPEQSRSLHAWLQPAFAAVRLDGTATGAAYATDASHYANAAAPVLVLGPGDITQAHTPDEWIARDELHRAVALYRAILALPPR